MPGAGSKALFPKSSTIQVESFDLRETLHSGQVFHWQEDGNGGWIGCLGEQPVWLAQPDAGTLLVSAGSEDAAVCYLGLDQPLSAIHETFPEGDAVLAEAMAYSPGLRILRQPVWECLATFITSSLKQVAHIRRISLLIRSRFGVEHTFQGNRLFAYPGPEALADAGEAALRQCGLGYRAKSLALTAGAVASGRVDLNGLENLDDALAREALMELHGVGEKIANCVLLFGCGRYGAFPIDVWMDRILRSKYLSPAQSRKMNARALQAWAEARFGPYAGYAQQYLFHYARNALNK